jgi:two-component system sensor histidine kinase TctE
LIIATTDQSLGSHRDDLKNRPSLRRRLLVFLFVSMLATVVFTAAVAYLAALHYSNRVHDLDLEEDARSVEKLLRSTHFTGELSQQVKFLIEYDSAGRNFFSIWSRRHGFVSGSAQAIPALAKAPAPDDVVLYDTEVGGLPVRAIALTSPSPSDPSDLLTVTFAETLQGRQRNARDILLLVVLIQLLLIAVLLAVVHFGVNFGLRIIDPLTQRLAARENELTPITDADVAIEILPLSRTIDGLFARLRKLIELHERFIADAAHQLRTPLTGLALHAEFAAHATQPEERAASLAYVQELAARVARTSSQLLSLTHAEAPLDRNQSQTLDLARLVPDIVGQHVQQALRSGVELGYDDSPYPILISGNPHSLRELVDNLVDNAIVYAARGGTVNVGLRSTPRSDACLSIDDSGPGVPAHLLPRLGERFFRAPEAAPGGTGLGLAIVQRIAAQHGARIVYAASALGGLRVEMRFPVWTES